MTLTCPLNRIPASPPPFASKNPTSLRSLQIYFFPWQSDIRWGFKGRSVKVEKGVVTIRSPSQIVFLKAPNGFVRLCNSMKVLPDYFQAEAQESPKGGQERGEHGRQQLNMNTLKGWWGKKYINNCGKRGCASNAVVPDSPCDAGAAPVAELQGEFRAPFFVSPLKIFSCSLEEGGLFVSTSLWTTPLWSSARFCSRSFNQDLSITLQTVRHIFLL